MREFSVPTKSIPRFLLPVSTLDMNLLILWKMIENIHITSHPTEEETAADERRENKKELRENDR